MANFAAIIANRGFYYTPHVVKGIGDSKNPLDKYKIRHYTTVDTAYFKYVVNGMERVVQAGTAAWSRIDGLSICGKTGTVQNGKVEGQKADHSVFIAFSPKYNPKIAIAVFVENAGFGAMTAAPIANLMIEKYLTDTITKKSMEDYILNKYLLPKTKPSTLPR